MESQAPAGAGTARAFELGAQLEAALQSGGASQVFETLCEALRKKRQYKELFDALLMRKRHELGLPLVQVGPATDIADEHVDPYEDAIAAACREVGELFLHDGDLVQAWPYLRAVGENELMRQAIERIEPGTRRKDIDGIVEIALAEGVCPARGLQIVVQHYGICSSITHFEQFQHALRTADRQACIGVLVQSLYADLVDNVRSEIEHLEDRPLEGKPGLFELIQSRPKLFEDEAYFIDSSHLHSIVRFSAQLEAGKDLDLAIELGEYGSRLAPIYQYESEPPFDDYYRDHTIYLRGLRAAATGEFGDELRAAGDHFEAKLRAALSESDENYPAGQVLAMLSRLERHEAAIELARKFEDLFGSRRPLSPNTFELCQVAGDYRALAEAAREAADPVAFAAGLLQESSPERSSNPSSSDRT